MGEHSKSVVYGKEFYAQHAEGMLRSARAIVPIVFAQLPVRSVIDIGCGCGAWLRASEECGVTDVAGYDGDHVDRSILLMNSAKFIAVDLHDDFEIPRTFDLAMSLEVAEHLPSEFAESFIRRLVTAAPIVLFSAAIPAQGGTHHVNEQWQDYWRSIFKSFGFYPVDLIRPVIWGHPDVEFWYQQNTILYCSGQALRNTVKLQPVPDDVSLNIVHRKLYEAQLAKSEIHLRAALRLFPSLVWNAARRRITG